MSAYLSANSEWRAIEAELGIRLIRVYALDTGLVRLDATVGTVNHDPAKHKLFQVGKAKNGQYATQFKLMLASLDPLDLPLVVNVKPGNRADDPLYVPSYQRAKQIPLFTPRFIEKIQQSDYTAARLLP